MTDIGNKEIMARNLAYYVNKSGKTQKELAEIAGVATSTFNDWMKAKKYPRIDKIERLADYFGILKSDLIEDKTKEKPATPEGNELSANKKALMQLVQNCSEEDAGRLLQIMQLFLENAKQGS